MREAILETTGSDSDPRSPAPAQIDHKGKDEEIVKVQGKLQEKIQGLIRRSRD
jgi:hypothetical protein